MAKRKRLKKSETDDIFYEAKGNGFTEKDILDKFKDLSYDPPVLAEAIYNFGLALTGVPVYEYQKDFILRVFTAVIGFENETLTGLWSRQSGKSESLAFVAATLCTILPILSQLFAEFKQFKSGFHIGLYAPQQLQVDTTHDRAMSRIGSDVAEVVLSDEEIGVGLTSAKKFVLTNGSFLLGQVASKSSKIESKTYHLIFLDEAQDLDDYVVQKSIEPMTSATGGCIIKVGSTGTVKNAFYYDIRDNKRRQRKLGKKFAFHFEFDYEQVIRFKRLKYNEDGDRFHLNYEQDVLKKRRRWGADSDAFKLGYSLIWPLESGMFITEGQFDMICNKKLSVPTSLKAFNGTIVAGLDLAKDSDYSVMTIGGSFYKDDMYTTEPPLKQIFTWYKWGDGMSYELQHYEFLEALSAWGVEVLYVDYTGVGKPVVDRLMAAIGDNITIVPYTFSTTSKSEMYLALDEDIKNRRLVVPASKNVRNTEEFEDFKQQFLGLLKYYSGAHLVCHHGDGVGEKDDFCDSAALFVMAGNHELPEEAEELTENPFYGGNSYTSPRFRDSHWT